MCTPTGTHARKRAQRLCSCQTLARGLNETHCVCGGALQALKELARLDLRVLLRGLPYPGRRQLAAP